MATGTIINWSGASGWIKQTGVSDLPTSQANDCVILLSDIVDGEVVLGSAVDFDVDMEHEPWLARNLAVVL